MATSYKQNISYIDSKRQNSFEDGLEFQDFVADLFATRLGIPLTSYASRKYQFDRGETVQGVEIKFDSWCSRTRRLSIETAEKSRADQREWIPSGIYREDNTWLYVQGNHDIVYVFAKSTLRILEQTGRFQAKEEPTLRAFYLPDDAARKYAALVFDIATQSVDDAIPF